MVRFGVSLAAMVAVFTAWRVVPNGTTEFGELGRDLFLAWHALVLTATWGLAPLAVALGIQEEREAGTLDMLALSGLRPRAVFAGVVVARTAAIGLIVIGSVPILGVALGLGGFGVDEVLLVTAQGFAGLLILAATSGVFALTARHPLLPAVFTWIWAAVTFGVVPFLFGLLLDMPNDAVVGANPFLAVGWDLTPALALWGLALALLTSAFVGTLGGTVLDIALSQDDDQDFGTLSPSRWILERLQRLLGAALVVTGIATLFFWPLELERWLPDPIWFVLCASIIASAQTSTGLLLVLKGIDVLHGLGRRSEVRRAEAMRRGLLDDVAIGADPVYWRDRQFGGPTARLVTGIGSVGLLGATLLTMVSDGPSTYTLIPVFGFGGAIAAGVLSGVACAIEEARGRSWRLLATTPISPSGFVAAKLGATVRASLPLWLLTLVVWVGFRFWLDPQAGWNRCPVPALPDPTGFGRTLWTGLWVLLQPVWLSALALSVARSAGPRWAWPAVMAALFLWFGPPLQFDGAFLHAWGKLVLPFARYDVWSCSPRGLPRSVVLSTGTHALLALFFTLVAARRLRGGE